MSMIHIWPETITKTDGLVTTRVTLEQPDKIRHLLWYRFPEEYLALLSPNCDSFVVATIFKLMQSGKEVIVHGTVSPSLLQNLSEFQAVWACWRPDCYQPVEIRAEIEQELTKLNESAESVITPFSGGVDSCFTVYRHHHGIGSRLQRHLTTAVMAHGLDIPLHQPEVFENARIRSEKMLSSLGMKLIPVATNFRSLKDDWEDACGVAIASCLTLFQGGYKIGLIPSGEPYQSLPRIWGSHPLTNPLLSNQNFSIIHDGAAFSRSQKIAHLAHWPEVLQWMRVCWQGEHKDRNCGYCEKCIRTILNFRVLGLDLPGCFEQDISDQQLSTLRIRSAAQFIEFELILQSAQDRHLSDRWVKILKQSIFRNKMIVEMKNRFPYLTNQLKKFR